MNKLTYLKLKAHAESLRHQAEGLDPDRENYLWGYLRGLSRHYHGEVYGQQDHDRLMSYADMEPVSAGGRSRYQKGLGYRDGLTAKPIGHGGPGRRQAADGAVGLMRKNISIDQASVDRLKALGDGDLSLGIRRAAAKL